MKNVLLTFTATYAVLLSVDFYGVIEQRIALVVTQAPAQPKVAQNDTGYSKDNIHAMNQKTNDIFSSSTQ